MTDNPSPFRGEGGARSRSEWEAEGIRETSDTVHLYVLVIGVIEATFGILLTLLMSAILQDQWDDPDAWAAFYMGIAWIVVPLAGIVASSLSRNSVTRTTVLVVLVGAALVYGGLLVA